MGGVRIFKGRGLDDEAVVVGVCQVGSDRMLRDAVIEHDTVSEILEGLLKGMLEI